MASLRLIGRREFLIASSTCALATTVVAPRLFAAEAPVPAKRLAVGFARATEVAPLIPASSIPVGDGTFLRAGALVTVSGTSGLSSEPLARRAVELRTNFAYFDGAESRSAPFRAWAANRKTGGQGNSIRFTVPMDLSPRITLTVVLESGERAAGAPTSRRRAIGAGPTGETALPLVLTVNDGEEGAIKLVRGYYVIVPLFEGEAEPDWSSYRLFRIDGRWALLDRSSVPASFEHLVLRVDYAMA